MWSAALGISSDAMAQPNLPAGEIQRAIERLNVVGSVLYVAAHPDDENTRLLAWLVGHKGLRASYLSMTRGGGGQNLIGGEQAHLLGVLRTGELLAARGIDGAGQYFTRMRDFGYSKSADETLQIWGRQQALSDVVQTIRQFRPDVVITRFSPTGRGHGHHLASAIVAGEAFVAAADPKRFKGLAAKPWQADRLLHNRSHWRIKQDTDTSQWLELDVGTYDPLIGRSYGEVAATSRSMHKSQGFGAAPHVGPQLEYFSPIAGTALLPADDPFKGLDFTWSRFPRTEGLSSAIAAAARELDPAAPQKILPQLVDIRQRIRRVRDSHWREIKVAEVERLIVACAGLWLTARATQPAVAPGGTVEVELTALNRAASDVVLNGVTLAGKHIAGASLAQHTPWTHKAQLAVGGRAPVSQPHWLRDVPTTASYVIRDSASNVLADATAPPGAAFDLSIGGATLVVRRPVEFAWTDPVAGERTHTIEILPPVTASFDHRVMMILTGSTAVARITLRSTGDVKGTLSLTAPAGFVLRPKQVPFVLTAARNERLVEVSVTAKPGAKAGPLSAVAKVGKRRWAFSQITIDYPHLPKRTVLEPSQLALVPVALKRGAVKRIGYLQGSGDAVADGLQAVGYDVEQIDEDAVAAGRLAGFDAVVMGIRAYNKHPRLLALHDQLMAYVAGGGRLIVQYNTNNRFNELDGPIGPKPFHISRERVTDETAEMIPVDASHPALNIPNQLTKADFAEWVQERGLYFADTWDPAYQPVFRVQDQGSEPLMGSLLVARHGKGVFVYTGISLFRQLPAGVPGAYRLFANLLAL